jgi:hypothetical protein
MGYLLFGLFGLAVGVLIMTIGEEGAPQPELVDATVIRPFEIAGGHVFRRVLVELLRVSCGICGWEDHSYRHYDSAAEALRAHVRHMHPNADVSQPMGE